MLQRNVRFFSWE